MKRFVVVLVFAMVCSTSMAGFSEDIESWYEDLLQFFDLYKDRDEVLEKVEAYDKMLAASNLPDSHNNTASIDINSEKYLNDLPLTDSEDNPGTVDNQVVDEDSDSTIISNPEPCAIILSSIGLGMAGYLKRRRVI